MNKFSVGDIVTIANFYTQHRRYDVVVAEVAVVDVPDVAVLVRVFTGGKFYETWLYPDALSKVWHD